MKSEQEIDKALDSIDVHAGTKYPGMTYEQGLATALEWVLEQITDEEAELPAA